jgi:hypothetical protein
LSLKLLVLLAVAMLTVTGCSKDTKDKANDLGKSVRKDAEENTGKLAAYALAETFRSSLKANAAAKEEGLRSIAALEEVEQDMPGKPDISGIQDDDHDGQDDDGKVLVKVNDKMACVIIPATGDNTDIEEGPC